MREHAAVRASERPVLHYVDQWLPVSAGFVHAQVSRSRRRGVVVSRRPVENLATFPHRPVHSIAALDRVPLPPSWRPKSLTVAVGARALASRAGLLHVHFGYLVNDVTALVRRRDLPLVLSLHGHDATAVPRADPRHYDAATRLASAVVVPSRWLAEVATDLGFAGERVHVIPSGVDLEVFRPAPLPPGPRVAFVGRLVEKKGIDVLAAAWPSVLSAVPDAELLVVGDGPAASLLPAGVQWERPDPGRRTAQVRDALVSARCVVTPSRTSADGDSESLLLVNLEAQAVGRPVVTTRHGGIPEFVDEGRTAVLVPENDAASLADAIVSVLRDDALAESLAAAGPAFAGGFDVAEGARRVDAVYDELLH
jgi:glycosyltransferase involved in cell wall biosynthesis